MTQEEQQARRNRLAALAALVLGGIGLFAVMVGAFFGAAHGGPGLNSSTARRDLGLDQPRHAAPKPHRRAHRAHPKRGLVKEPRRHSRPSTPQPVQSQPATPAPAQPQQTATQAATPPPPPSNGGTGALDPRYYGGQ